MTATVVDMKVNQKELNEEIHALKEDIRECLGVACNELVTAQCFLNELKEAGGGDAEEIDEAIEKLNRLWDEVWDAWIGDAE